MCAQKQGGALNEGGKWVSPGPVGLSCRKQAGLLAGGVSPGVGFAFLSMTAVW